MDVLGVVKEVVQVVGNNNRESPVEGNKKESLVF
jgi:hypothetical protein